MTNPIGNKIGNALEIAEVIECLHGGGPKALTNLIEQLGKSLLFIKLPCNGSPNIVIPTVESVDSAHVIGSSSAV
jgi:hypothetical protein